jgi:hypothetical protein
MREFGTLGLLQSMKFESTFHTSLESNATAAHRFDDGGFSSPWPIFTSGGEVTPCGATALGQSTCSKRGNEPRIGQFVEFVAEM